MALLTSAAQMAMLSNKGRLPRKALDGANALAEPFAVDAYPPFLFRLANDAVDGAGTQVHQQLARLVHGPVKGHHRGLQVALVVEIAGHAANTTTVRRP